VLNPQFAADAQDNIIIAGMVSDCTRPVMNTLYSCGGYWIAKYDPSGATLLFATYFGDPYEQGQQRTASLRGMGVDLSGNIIILSSTTANSLPSANGA
jgi:hypothetical protein